MKVANILLQAEAPPFSKSRSSRQVCIGYHVIIRIVTSWRGSKILTYHRLPWHVRVGGRDCCIPAQSARTHQQYQHTHARRAVLYKHTNTRSMILYVQEHI